MQRENVKGLLAERAALVSKAREVFDAADAEKRSMSGEERGEVEKIDGAIAELDSRVEDAMAAEKREQRTAELRSQLDIFPSTEPAEPKVEKKEDQAANVADWFRGYREGFGELEVRKGGHIEDVRRGAEFRYIAPADAEYRVQTVGSATAGGDVVPTDFYAMLTRVQVFNSNVLSMNPTFIDTDGGHNLQVPTVGPTYGVAAAPSENATAAAADDTFGQATLKAFKFEVFVQLSRELIDDSGVDIIGYVANDAGRKLVNKYGSKLVTGAGTTEPQGLMTAATTAVTAASASLTFDNLISLYHAVVPQYRGNGVFLMNDQTVASIRQLKDNNGRYLLDISTVPGLPDTLWGRAVYQDPNVAQIGHSNVSVAFGDPKGYFVRRVNGVRFERSDEFAFDKDLVTFRAIVRLDGQLIDTGAWRTLVHS